jgi:hypothetical protein
MEVLSRLARHWLMTTSLVIVVLIGLAASSRNRRESLSTAGDQGDTISGITWQLELEPEVADWLGGLDDQRWAQALFHMDLLEQRGVLLGEPYTRQLSGKLRELRFYCGEQRTRVTYWMAPGRRIIALTVFTKTRMQETGEIRRALRAMARCQQESHLPDEESKEGSA